MKLDRAKKGSVLRILSIPDPLLRAQAIRFGISEGESVTCAEVIPSGPIIISKNHQEIALGRELAREIEVEVKAN
ncbi:FeoA family protein [Desulforudis sp. 1088]|uniref:FeoA family protein n=1 Tax=unclassified Candidatus Desulforudis TaxID=2635950 RepID=UPI00348B323E